MPSTSALGNLFSLSAALFQVSEIAIFPLFITIILFFKILISLESSLFVLVNHKVKNKQPLYSFSP
jgi:hypothetical protein